MQWLALVYLASLVSSVVAGHHTLCQKVAILAGLVSGQPLYLEVSPGNHSLGVRGIATIHNS